MKNDDVLYVSEHRGSYSQKKELPNYLSGNFDIILFPISITRFEAQKAKKTDTPHNIGALLFFLPGYGVTLKNTEEATKAAKERALHLNKLKEKHSKLDDIECEEMKPKEYLNTNNKLIEII